MVETISPVVHGGNARRYARTVAIHIAAAGLTAGALGAVAGGAGVLVGAGVPPMVVVLATCAAVYASAEIIGLRVPFLERRAQVPEWWRTFFHPDVAAALYGIGLGVGFATYIRHGTFSVVILAAFFASDPLWGAAMCAPFGLTRAASVLRSAGARDQDDVDGCIRRIERQAGGTRERALNAAALTAVAVAALA